MNISIIMNGILNIDRNLIEIYIYIYIYLIRNFKIRGQVTGYRMNSCRA